MSYIGLPPKATFSSGLLDRFTSTTGTTVTLTPDIASENDIVVFVNFVKQDSTTYSVGGTGNKTLTLGGTLVSSDIVEVHYLNIVGQTVAPSSGSVTTATINDTAVTGAKLNTDVISAQTELATAPASTDELLVSDAGVLKRVDVSLVGGNNTPSFKAYGATQAIPNNTATVIAYNTELWDTDSDYDNSTYRFTPQVSGKYFVYSIIRVESGSSYNHLELRIRKNGGDMAHAFNSPKYYDTVNVSALVDMNGSSDYIDFAIFQGSGGSLNTNSGRQFNQGGAFKLIGV